MKRLFVLFLFVFLPASGFAEGQVPTSAVDLKLSFAPVVRRSAPSVVNIYASKVVAARPNPFASDPFFSDFFQNFGAPAPQVQKSLGSGVILSPDGLVVSNYHVVGGATEIRVVLTDRREFDARVLLADKRADLAVLRLKGAHGLPAMKLAHTAKVEVGDLVLAIGNPFGVGQTVSSGIISGLARSGGAVGNARAYFIQTDAPINPGNSGGALVDMRGDLVGINTSILTRSGGSNGIGFAIPADLVSAFLDQARQGNKRFQRPWAGIIGQMVDRTLAKGLNLRRPKGMVIAEIHPASPFARAGLKTGDVVVSFNGQSVNGPAELLYRMSVAGIGQSVKLGYIRAGRQRVARVGMILPPETPPRNQRHIGGRSPLQGLTVARINPAVIAGSNLPLTARGVVVLKATGVAARIGFQAGDILSEVNGQRMQSVAKVLAAANSGARIWDITITRNGRTLTMRLKT